MTTINIADDWLAEVRASLGARADLAGRLEPAMPAGYDELNDPPVAALDFVNIDALATGMAEVTTDLFQRADGSWRFRIYRRGESIPLADMLPLLDHLGLRALDERAFGFAVDGVTIWLHDVGVSLPTGVQLSDQIRAEVQRTFLAEFTGSIEVDGLNRLVLLVGLTARQTEILRAYSRYLRQIGFPFSQQYIEATLARHAAISRLLASLFAARFDPASAADASTGETDLRAEIAEALDAVPSLDDDRTLRSLLALIDATVRTNAFRPADGGGYRPVLSYKFDTSKMPDLPLPRPMFEIWVCSPRVEGIHLRNGRIARGGIRWSDRREDFRTEVLGLVKAQIVKNAVIVPTGAKGGFVLKKAPAGAEEFRAEGVACYREFICGLLDVTDNIVGGEIVPPPDTVRHDGDDPYLVVAADKGTATFSDIANEISAAYGFWLGDAFASGGSEGFDHKAMAITARGAWESVRRHARALGKDADRDELTIIGIGDMSGDVFGNGLLRSPHVKLVAAFDHRHIFIDPDPDPAVSFVERKRLFDLPRSSWANYDTSLLSAGGAIYPRTLKRIMLTPEARKRLGTDRSSFTPNELLSTILRAPVDVLWNGGIGTYVKASPESHTDVGDRSNDGLRVNGSELRCRIVGEGGNLGLTQRGRIEFALHGGLVNTDAIDNSAGVDCSDHEVNIKVLLGMVMAEGKMSLEQRNAVLAEMTTEVGELVLDDNRSQTLTLAIARRQALPMVNVHARYLHVLESEGWLNRTLEFLPTDKQIAERQSSALGLTTPEFAIVLAYTKSVNMTEMVHTEFPDDPYLEPDLVRYFPTLLQRQYRPEILRHRLRREIIATQIANQMVNLSGISFDNRMTEDTGAGVVDVVRSWVAARDIFNFPAMWDQIEALPTHVKLDTQLEMFLEARRMVERGALWLLRHRRPPLEIASVVAEFQPGIGELSTTLEAHLRGKIRDQMFANEAARLAAGVPEQVAQRSVLWPLMHTAFDIIDLAHLQHLTVRETAAAYWQVFDALDLGWLWDAVGMLPRNDRWQTQARSALRDDLMGALAALADDALYVGGAREWASANERVVGRATAMFTEIRRADAYDLTTLSVALRQLRNLALITQRPPTA
ncbi:MAG: NAD-glutamate dehydrogenase domain-containing protein [Ilumatobacteraceae bacterium]